MTDPIRMAIADILEGDDELTALAPGGVHWRHAPQNTKPPLVIFNAQVPGVRTYTFDGPPLRTSVWLVKGVGFADDAEDINARCQVLLADQALPGVDLRLAPLPDDDVSYEEGEHGDMYDHNGTNYRVMSE